MLASLGLLSAGVLLQSCNKTSETVKPIAAVTASQNAEPTEAELKEQNNFLYYLQLLEDGTVTDPTGQYVAKSNTIDPTDDEETQGEQGPKGDDRPKYDAATGTVDWGYSSYVASGGTFDTPKIAACKDCPVPKTSGEGGVPVVARFANSVGIGPYVGPTNPNGYIYDVKIAKGNSSNPPILPGYTAIRMDLNAGAGGQYIYLTFTRNPGSVKYGDEINGSNQGYNFGYRVVGPVRVLRSYSQRIGATFTGYRSAVPMWTPGLFSTWKQPDLNDGAGGRFIYGYQGKGDNDGAPIEVGILSGNSSSIAPPAGWIKINGSNGTTGVDLNEGAGGDYVYFCMKR